MEINGQIIRSVVILGGGAAGWLSAGRIAAAYKNIDVCLIESANQGILGVGEGTWPSMRESLRKIGIREHEFIKDCDASFKQGSWFTGWTTADDTNGYCHPFSVPFGYQETDLHQVWRSLQAQFPSDDPLSSSYAGLLSVQSIMCELNKAPKQQDTPEYAGVLNYGYHLDAHKFATLLSKHCKTNLKVKHIIGDVDSVLTHKNGDIRALKTATGESIEGQLFIDCSGMQSRLIGKHYDIDSIDVSEHLINDSAVAAHVPYATDEEIKPYTLSTAKENGWIWDIGLQTRKGLGMVFSSQFSSHEQAQDTLKQHITDSNPSIDVENIKVRNLSFRPSYKKTFWHKNCLAIGMAAGFVEPLEASALAMTELSLNMLIDEFPLNRSHMDLCAKRFNQRFLYRWQRVIDFIQLHYVLSKRSDSPYWKRMSDPRYASNNLQELLELWRFQPPSRHDLIQNEEVFPSASYQFIVYGMGYQTQIDSSRSSTLSKVADKILQHNSQQTRQLAANLPNNKALLKQQRSINS